MEELSSKKRVRDETDESDLGSPEVKRLRDDLLDLLDDSDICTTSQDLDSFMKSFEEEITAPSPQPVTVVDLTSDSGESQQELGYLFEASDDDLGLPPSTNSPSSHDIVNLESDLTRVSSDSSELSELWKFDEQISSYDSFGTGYADADDFNAGEYVALEGLFDYSDVGFDSSEFSWRTETLPAL